MKKLLFLSLFFSLFLSSAAQLKTEEFAEKDRTIQQELSKAFNNKDYPNLEKALHQQIDLFSQLLPSDQQENIGYLQNVYYNFACLYSLDKKTKRAVEYFSKTIDSGYKNFYHANQDTDLDNIRKNKEFIRLMAILKDRGDYTQILRTRGNIFKDENTETFPKFTYESATDYRLQSVKELFNLDSVAGNGDETSRIINVMTWLHNTIEHDGSHMPYCEINAIDLYYYYKATKRGINCRALAIMLNEMYLSLGFKSRYVTCLPEDAGDSDCHVINSVYSETLKKWIWMDPTFNAYLKDENNNLLSIMDVREKIINGSPIILNEDANWNNRQSWNKKQYIDSYMAKNLFWLECPASSSFNIESPYRSSSATYIALVPDGFKPWNSSKNTSDVNYFWGGW